MAIAGSTIHRRIDRLSGIIFLVCFSMPGLLLARTITVTLPGGAPVEMVLIPAGRFVMGSPDDEAGRRSDESPQHSVVIAHPFYLGRYEVTQGQWESVMGSRPWSGKSHVQDQPDYPAVYISQDDAQLLVAHLNDAEGDSLYRLPTEAEWEYACRAGTRTRWSSGDQEDSLAVQAWYRENLEKPFARAVGTRQPNPWGLYDMHGNVWEWVMDRYGPYGGQPGAEAVNRGGSFYDKPQRLRSAYRNHDAPSYQSADTGWRLLRRIP